MIPGDVLTREKAGNILRGWRGGGFEDRKKLNAETQRTLSDAEKRLA